MWSAVHGEGKVGSGSQVVHGLGEWKDQAVHGSGEEC